MTDFKNQSFDLKKYPALRSLNLIRKAESFLKRNDELLLPQKTGKCTSAALYEQK
jgi:hypothetical protein